MESRQGLLTVILIVSVFSQQCIQGNQKNRLLGDYYYKACKVTIPSLHLDTCLTQNEKKQLQQFDDNPKFNPLFRKYTQQFNKNYCDPQISKFRKAIFESNVRKIVKHNAVKERRYNMGLTRFTDLHPKEYIQKFANLQVTIPDTIRLTSAEKLKILRTQLENSSTRLKELTLRKKRLEKLIQNTEDLKKKNELELQVREIQAQIRQLNQDSQETQKNIQQATSSLESFIYLRDNMVVDWSCMEDQVHYQSNCGSCYLFALQSLITMRFQQYDIRISLSPQHYLSCISNAGTKGCCGGELQDVIQHAQGAGMVQRQQNFQDFIHNNDLNAGLNCLLTFSTSDIDCTFPYDQFCSDLNDMNQYYGLQSTRCENVKNNFQILRYRILYQQYEDKINSCEYLIPALEQKPVVVGIIGDNLQHYKCGTYTVYVDKDNYYDTMEQINHAMVAVGYHHEKGYLLKDSRGYINGLAGYIWVNKDESLNAGVCRHGFSVTPDLTDYPDAKFSKEDCCNTFF